MLQQGLVLSKRQPTETISRKRAAFNYFKDKREWVKLNSSFLIGAGVSSGMMHAASQIAENHGVSRAVATTFVAGVTGYVFGTIATCLSWLALNKVEYSGKLTKVVEDTINLLKSTVIAQTLTWSVSWLATGFVLYNDATNFWATLTQQFFGIVYLPIFNYLNKDMVNGMQNERMEK
ncbi:MAG: hypothetical protein ABH842_05430 [Candidatus Micrarchaeota archaeon]